MLLPHLMLVVALAGPPVERLDSALEDTYDAALARAWPAANKHLKAAEAALGPAGLPAGLAKEARAHLGEVHKRLAARDGLAAARAVNALSWTLVPLLARESGFPGLARLDPMLREVDLALRAKRPGPAHQAALQLRVAMAGLSCGADAAARGVAATTRLIQALDGGEVAAARKRVSKVDDAIDQAEGECRRERARHAR